MSVRLAVEKVERYGYGGGFVAEGFVGIEDGENG